MELEQVKFNKKWITPIRSGVKTQTMRIPEKRIETPVGKIIAAIFPGTLNVIALLITKKGINHLKILMMMMLNVKDFIVLLN